MPDGIDHAGEPACAPDGRECAINGFYSIDVTDWTQPDNNPDAPKFPKFKIVRVCPLPSIIPEPRLAGVDYLPYIAYRVFTDDKARVMVDFLYAVCIQLKELPQIRNKTLTQWDDWLGECWSGYSLGRFGASMSLESYLTPP